MHGGGRALQRFSDDVTEICAGDPPDRRELEAAMTTLAGEADLLAPLIEAMPPERAGGRWLLKPERGPRLALFHRPEATMSYVHSHSCVVVLAPVLGVETHQRWDAVPHDDGTAEITLAEERRLHLRDAVTLVPPHDIHSHGHEAGSGPSPYTLILLGDDQLALWREEYDPDQSSWRRLAPGDRGRDNR